jgi:Tol biopolymer transport system component
MLLCSPCFLQSKISSILALRNITHMKALCTFLTVLFPLLLSAQSLPLEQRPSSILQQPASIQLQRLYKLNSPFRETNLNITPDGKYLYFMSGRGQMPWSTANYTEYKGKPEFDGDIWYSKRLGKEWQVPVCLGERINSAQGEDEPNISPDGQTVYFQSWKFGWESNGGPYYQASLKGTTWGQPQGLGGGINTFFVDMATQYRSIGTDGMTISPDGNTYIVAAGDYQGNMNLYIAYKRNGTWTYPVKLSVSTQGNDRHPFIAADGKTLYFSSNGYKGFGGMDIFKTTLLPDGRTGEVVNIGTPFNTDRDDYGLIVSGDGQEAYFVRDGDIYFADISKSPEKMKPAPSLIISGVVKDQKTGKPLGVALRFSNAQGKLLSQVQSNSVSGEFSLVLHEFPTSLSQVVQQQGYQNFQKRYAIKINPEGNNKLVADVYLIPLPDANLVAEQKRQQEERKRQEERKKIPQRIEYQASVYIPTE